MKMKTIFQSCCSALEPVAVRAVVFILAVVLLLLTFFYLPIQTGGDVTAQNFVDLQEGESPYHGYRRAHAKGICVSGVFESNGLLDNYSTASIFDKGATAFIGRYSVAGNNPGAVDRAAPVRSLAVKLLLNNNQQWRIAMNTPPVMAVRNPEDFYQQLLALSPDPVTKQRDPKKITAFF